ncbi:T9SS type A sorting domain-containing protein [Bacteroidota bacterium]
MVNLDNRMKITLFRFLSIPFILLTSLSSNASPYTCITAGGLGCWYRDVTEPIYRCTGETVSLYARKTGSSSANQSPVCDNPSYQWYTWTYDGGIPVETAMAGETNNKLTVANVGSYRCYVFCTGDNYWTGSAQVFYTSQGPVVTQEPESDAVCPGESVKFSVAASGKYLSYQWQVMEPLGDWTNLTDAKTADYNFIPLANDDQKQYKCIVSNACNSDISAPALLTINTPALVEIEPENVSVCENSAAGFSVSVTGSSLTYDWQESVSGGDTWQSLSSSGNYEFYQSGNLTVISAGSGMDGYQYRAIITGICAPGDTSLAAQLSIKPPPFVIMQPGNDTACVGEGASFEISANGTPPLLYKWQKGGKTVKDWSAENYLEINELSLDDNQKVVVLVSDKCFSTSNPVSSDEASLVVVPLPSFSLGDDRRICSGSTTILNPGNGYSRYEWSNGDSTQTVEVGQQGLYTVTVTDDKSCSAEDVIFIFVDPPVPDVNLGSDTSLCGGSQITLDAGAGFDWYEWSDGSSNQTSKASITGTHWVKAGNNNTVCEAIDTLEILISEPYNQAEICLITIDQASGKYMIIWERTPDQGIDQYNLYREGQWIGTVAYDDLSIYKDLDADPEKRPYRYEMSITDTCGNESGFTPFHIPIFLQYSGFIDGVNLSWSKYQVEGKEVDFNSYSVYKGSDSILLAPFEENIPTEVLVYIDKDPAALDNTYYYRIAGILSEPCNVSGGSKKAGTAPYTHSLSNMDDNKLRATNAREIQPDASLSIFPNPAHQLVTVNFRNPDARKYILGITDISGKIVRIDKDISTSDFTFRVEDLSPGYYHLTLTGDQIFHGNLIVE